MSVHTRRTLLQAGIGLAGLVVAPAGAAAAESPLKGRIQKAVKYGMIAEDLSAVDKLKLLKDLGFDGVELRINPPEQSLVKELAKAREAADFPVHGVTNSSNPDLVGAIDQAKMLGATSVLHVVRYDRNASYLQNYKQTQEIIRRAVDHAAKNAIQILLENVWASFLIEPLTMARYVDEIDSPWVQVYFDVGNVVRWGWPEHWIEVLGKRVKKLDIKEYDLDVAMNQGMRKGFATPIGQGSIRWDRVRRELLNIDYHGWATAEVAGGDRKRLAEIAEQMDRVLELV